MSASQIEIRRVRESSAGVLPAGNMLRLPVSSFDLASKVKREKSDNVSSDRQVQDNAATDFDTTGSVNADYFLRDHDSIHEELFCNPYSDPATTGSASLSCVATGNKITRAAGDFTTDGFADGDLVWVTGFSTNGAAFLARVRGTVTTTDLPLDPDFKTLVDEGPVAACTVKHDGQLVLGTTLLLASWERWNKRKNVGSLFSGVGVTSGALSLQTPGRLKWAYGLMGFVQEERLSVRSANATDEPVANSVITTGKMFGDRGTAGSGMGLRYAGDLLTDLMLQKLDLKIGSPLGVAGGAGYFGPQDIDLEGEFDVTLDLGWLTGSTDGETIAADAQLPDTVTSFGFGVKDRAGARQYFWLPKLQPADNSDTGPSKSGRQNSSASFMAQKDSLDSMIRIARFL